MSLADVTEALFARFEGRVPLPTIARMVRRCRRELDIASAAALPELLTRLACQRLTHLADRGGQEAAERGQGES